MKGWLISSSPSTREGDSTQWYASFWEFCARYCENRLRCEWRLSPEHSILLHAENTVIPTQVVMHSPRGTDNKIELLFGASLYDLRQPEMLPAPDLTMRGGLRLISPAAMLPKCSGVSWTGGIRLSLRTSHHEWYGELFRPCVAAGLVPPSALAGYRNEAVFLRASRYVPPRWEAVRDAMSALFELLEMEEEPGVRAVLGHWLVGYIHPYADGNGRMARFLMNAMLASGGYPWTLVRVEDRTAYLTVLDSASIDAVIGPFARFIAERVRRSMEQGGA